VTRPSTAAFERALGTSRLPAASVHHRAIVLTELADGIARTVRRPAHRARAIEQAIALALTVRPRRPSR
jgi:hypothetical protein